MLYIVSTPIGNLSDMTFRAVEVLKRCDYILCEDTRHSKILLNHYQIDTKTISYHKFNEAGKEAKIVDDLKAGMQIALISDAGTPGVSDPGVRLVHKCAREGFIVTSIPGPSASLAALTSSGFKTDKFQFIGFLPRKQSEYKRTLVEALSYSGTTIFYESPHRLLKILSAIHELAPDREICVAKELTKKHEALHRGVAEELVKTFSESNIRGEFVVLISGDAAFTADKWTELSPEEHLAHVQTAYSLSRPEAIKLVAAQRGVPKKEIYKLFCK